MPAIHQGQSIAEDVLDRLRSEDREILDLDRDLTWLSTRTRHPYVALHRMERAGLLHRLQAGRYVAELSGEPASAPAFRALEPLAPALLRALDHPYYLSWHTALFHHGLLEQQSSTIYAAASKRKRHAEFSGYSVRFIRLPLNRFDSGWEEEAIAGASVRMATVCRALVDSIERPAHAGPFPVVINALRSAWELDLLEPQSLIEEVITTGRHVVARRVGFLMERWGIPEAEQLQPHLGRGYAVPLSPGGLPYRPGVEVNSRWGVVIDEQLLFTAEHLK